MRKLVFVIGVLGGGLLVAGWLVSAGRQAEPFPEGSVSASRLQPGPHMVHSHNDVFTDDSRPSEAHGSFAGLPHRRLEVTVWHPAENDGGPFPLIVYSHGFSSNRDGGAYIGEHLASHGYVVVAADYPLTNMYAPDRPYVKDVVNQPGDVSFIIDQLLAQSRDEDHMLYRTVDGDRIGVTGISLGGMTSTLVAFHPTLGDYRVGAALSIAGPTAQFTEQFFRHRRVPFLMLAGDIDAMVPFRSNALPVLVKVPGSQLVEVVNGSHTGFAGPAASLRYMSNPDELGCFIVERSIENDVEEFWFDRLGTREQGIDYDSASELCQLAPLPEAMNPLRQHMITSVVVRAFFDSQFAGAERAYSGARFLSRVLPAELEEVNYASAD
jgi:dienelactone hydrolase